MALRREASDDSQETISYSAVAPLESPQPAADLLGMATLWEAVASGAALDTAPRRHGVTRIEPVPGRIIAGILSVAHSISVQSAGG